MAKQEDDFRKVISHAKEYGYVFQSSEIYDGLSAVYDYGQNGAELKKNIREYWWKAMVQLNENIIGRNQYRPLTSLCRQCHQPALHLFQRTTKTLIVARHVAGVKRATSAGIGYGHTIAGASGFTHRIKAGR